MTIRCEVARVRGVDLNNAVLDRATDDAVAKVAVEQSRTCPERQVLLENICLLGGL